MKQKLMLILPLKYIVSAESLVCLNKKDTKEGKISAKS